jgi:L-seryl-tRNA(Ser) seleniumtransferase
VRIDKLSLAALEATLALYRDPARALREVPVLRMLAEDPAPRAARLASLCGGEVVEATAKVGGGALPLVELPGPVVAVGARGASPDALAARMRAGDPPVVGRIADGRLLLDPRTLADDEVEDAARAVRAALA